MNRQAHNHYFSSAAQTNAAFAMASADATLRQLLDKHIQKVNPDIAAALFDAKNPCFISHLEQRGEVKATLARDEKSPPEPAEVRRRRAADFRLKLNKLYPELASVLSFNITHPHAPIKADTAKVKARGLSRVARGVFASHADARASSIMDALDQKHPEWRKSLSEYERIAAHTDQLVRAKVKPKKALAYLDQAEKEEAMRSAAHSAAARLKGQGLSVYKEAVAQEMEKRPFFEAVTAKWPEGDKAKAERAIGAILRAKIALTPVGT